MEAFSEVLTKSPIVIDNGSGVLKAGFSGEDKPKIMFNTYVGRPKYKPVLPNVKQQAYHVGNFKEENRGLLKLSYPMKRGIVQDWDDMDRIWKHTFSELKAKPNEYPIFLTEAAQNPIKEKVKMAHHFFETYSTPALFIGVQGVLSLFASGKTTGVVVECGDSVTQVVPVFEGYYLSHANQRMDLGGRDITDQLKSLLRRSGYSFNTSAEWEILKQFKEQLCVVNPTSQPYDDKYNKYMENYMLPDGTPIGIGIEKNQAPEILFNPDKIGLELPSISELFTNCIQKTDIDLRRTLFQEVVISGGTTLLHGFPERFIGEVKKLSNKEIKMKFFVPPNRNTLAWQGGGILSSLNYFKNMWISKKEYEDEGERILLKKSF